MIEPRFLVTPFTKTAAGVPGELLIAADNAAPAVEADCNVIMATRNDRAPQKICIMGRVSGAAEATADLVVKWFAFHWKTGEFYPAATLQMVGSGGITATLGNIWVLSHNPQCQKGYIQVVNLKAGQALNLVVDTVEL